MKTWVKFTPVQQSSRFMKSRVKPHVHLSLQTDSHPVHLFSHCESWGKEVEKRKLSLKHQMTVPQGAQLRREARAAA